MKQKTTITEADENLRKGLIKYLELCLSALPCFGDLHACDVYLKPRIKTKKDLRRFESLLMAHGGYCDCEVCLNVDKPWEVGKEIEVDF